MSTKSIWVNGSPKLRVREQCYRCSSSCLYHKEEWVMLFSNGGLFNLKEGTKSHVKTNKIDEICHGDSISPSSHLPSLTLPRQSTSFEDSNVCNFTGCPFYGHYQVILQNCHHQSTVLVEAGSTVNLNPIKPNLPK